MTDTYPQAVMVKKTDGAGYGFFFNSETDFVASAEAFLTPINNTIEEKLADKKNQADSSELRLAAALSFLSQYFDGTLDDFFSADAMRWVAAACASQLFHSKDMPSVIVVEQDGDKVGVREGEEFMDDPGFPKAVVVGRPQEGGGAAQFFESEKDYTALGQSTPTESVWLPQILFRLYERTPVVMAGVPKRNQDSETLGVECQGLSFSGDADPIERK